MSILEIRENYCNWNLPYLKRLPYPENISLGKLVIGSPKGLVWQVKALFEWPNPVGVIKIS